MLAKLTIKETIHLVLFSIFIFIGCSSSASGFFSVLIISSLHLQSFWLGWIVGSWPLFWALFTSFVLGTAYSINVSWYCFIHIWVLYIPQLAVESITRYVLQCSLYTIGQCLILLLWFLSCFQYLSQQMLKGELC